MFKSLGAQASEQQLQVNLDKIKRTLIGHKNKNNINRKQNKNNINRKQNKNNINRKQK